MAAPQSNATTEFTVSLLLGKTYVLSAKGTGGVWYEPTVGSGITADQLNCDNERRAVTLTPTADETIRVWRGGSLDFQIEETTGHPDENIPGDYVSVGMGVDEGSTVEGAANFTYANGNTIAAGVVTEAKGADLTTDWGALFEPASTNYADTDDDLSGGDAETVDLTASGTGDYTYSGSNDAVVTVAAGTATGTGFGQTSAGGSLTFNLTGAGTITLTKDSGTLATDQNGNYIKQVEKQSFATSFIPAPGGNTSRTADDGSPMFDYANWSQTEGTYYMDVVVPSTNAPLDQGIFGIRNNAQSVLYIPNGTTDFATNDGTGISSVEYGTIPAGNVIRPAVDFGTGLTMEIGRRDVTGAGSYVWDATPANYDGAYTTDNVINVFYNNTRVLRIRDLTGFKTRRGRAWLEANT